MKWNLLAYLSIIFVRLNLLSSDSESSLNRKLEFEASYLSDPSVNKSAKNIKGIVSYTKKIDLDAFPNAYNPSLIKIDDGFLLIFRYLEDPILQPWISHIGVVFLNESLDQISEPTLLSTRIDNALTPSQAEDARIFGHDGHLYLVFNDNQDVINTSIKDRRDMYIAELVHTNNQISLLPAIKLFHSEKLLIRTWEKNWVPFEWNGNILLSYSINPHEVFDLNLEQGECTTLYKTSTSIDWKWGELRGGTPALLVDDEYLAFFHSAKELVSGSTSNKKMWHYFMGAYTFSANPPFEINNISPLPIIEKTFYSISDSPKRVIYPGGYAVVGSNIYLAYGKDDQEIWIAVIDKDKLKRTLRNSK